MCPQRGDTAECSDPDDKVNPGDAIDLFVTKTVSENEIKEE